MRQELVIFLSTSPVGFPGGTMGRESYCQCRRQETQIWSLGWEDPLEEGMATHCSTLAWTIPWTEGRGGLQSIGSQRVGHDWRDWAHTYVRGKSCCCICVLSAGSAAGRQTPLQRAECGKKATVVRRAGPQRGGEVPCKEVSKPPVSRWGRCR